MINNSYWKRRAIFSNNTTTGGLSGKKAFMGKGRGIPKSNRMNTSITLCPHI